MFHQETLLLAVALTFCRANVADKNSLHVPKAVLRLARSLNTADNAIPERYESYSQQNYKCISEGIFEDPNDCGQYYDCIQTDTGELVALKKSCFGHGFDTTIKACAQTDMVKGCSLSPTERLRSFTFADPTLLKVCKDFKNEFMCSDCKTLVMCVNSRAYSVSCGQGLLCSSNKTEFTGGVCYPGAPSECTCNKDNSFRKDIYNPSKFISCDYLGSDPEIHTCPNGAVFNEELITCGTHAESTCSISGSFAKMSDCNKYYTCILTTEGWLQKDFSCTDSSQMFNDKTGVCEDPCDWYTGDYIGHFDCTQEGRFANPGDCKTFYDCIKDPIEYGNFTRVEHRCPEGYEWGPIANRSFCVASSTATEECVPSKPNNCIIPSGRCSATTVPSGFELYHGRVIRRTNIYDTMGNYSFAMSYCDQFGAKPLIPIGEPCYQLYKDVKSALNSALGSDTLMWLPADDIQQEGTLQWYNGVVASNISLWDWSWGTEYANNGEERDCLWWYYSNYSNSSVMFAYCDDELVYPPICERM